MKRIVPALLASAAATAALITGTAGSAQAASGVTCSLWKSVAHGNKAGYSLTVRSCIQWDGTSSDRAYTEVRNIDNVTHYVDFGAGLFDDGNDKIASKYAWQVAIAPTQSAKVYTNWVDDYTWGPERSLGTVTVTGGVTNTGWVDEPWF
ncbi:hypothetical protein OG462_43220 [Streptomyces sp. NBC_01077]|uniref:hypothetical protein n=1 Tax=Streptomyces sp. NBC_01077 TaxID=2903746 RepID=UPI00386A4D15|nr:hypothetical protein OG462_01785 [Streptomyces sp. NBC_01077]WSV43601.1 hypothetical protein OG462_43220 [Streptomyces sp. NBC_01077]